MSLARGGAAGGVGGGAFHSGLFSLRPYGMGAEPSIFSAFIPEVVHVIYSCSIVATIYAITCTTKRIIMARIDYKLFRIKLIMPSQPSLFDGQAPFDKPQMLIDALELKPELQKWHIGNVELFSGTSGYFAVGRLRRSTIAQYEENSKNFKEEELDISPYTHCVFDARIGILGIAQKNILAPTTEGIAKSIKKLLSKDPKILENRIRVEISPIPDPGRFLNELESAYSILRYTATFHGPNPFDADEYFQKPMSKFLSDANGLDGKATINGTALNLETLKEVTKSTAATGNTASAKIRREANSHPELITMCSSILGKSYEESAHDPHVVLGDLQTLYLRARE